MLIKNINVLSITPGLLLAVSGGVFAQSKNFEGYSFSLGAAANQLKVKSGSDTSSTRKTSGNVEFTSFSSLDDNWLVGFGVGFDTGSMGSVTSGAANSTFYQGNGQLSACQAYVPGNCYEYSGGQSKTKFSQNLSISIIPAYAFNKNHLGFLRASFDSMKAVKTLDGGGGWVNGDIPITPPTELPSSSGNAGSKRLNALGFGLGYRFQSDDRWFAQAEYRYVAFKKNDFLDVKPTLSGAVLSVGYTF